jgi:hypothetical protein
MASSLVYDLENQDGTYQKNPKSLFAGDQYSGGQPQVIVTEDEIVLAANDTNVIRVDPKYGVLLSGQLSLAATPEQISFGGGYWKFNPLLLSCIPSTSATPIPVLIKSTPALLPGASSLSAAMALVTANSDIG